MTQEYAIVILVHVTPRNVQIVYTFMQIMEFDVGPLCHAFFWVKNYFNIIIFSGNMMMMMMMIPFSSFEDSDHEFRLIPFTCDDPNCAFCCHTCNDLECPYCSHRSFDPHCPFCNHLCNDPECPLCHLDWNRHMLLSCTIY